jgi:hypothetical protein
MIHLYTKYNLNPSNHHWENEQKLSFSRVCIPNIIWIHLPITEKMKGNYHYQECVHTKYHLNPSPHHWENEQKLVIIKSVTDGKWTDGRRTGWTSPHHNTSCFQWAYKKFEENIIKYTMNLSTTSISSLPFDNFKLGKSHTNQESWHVWIRAL